MEQEVIIANNNLLFHLVKAHPSISIFKSFFVLI